MLSSPVKVGKSEVMNEYDPHTYVSRKKHRGTFTLPSLSNNISQSQLEEQHFRMQSFSKYIPSKATSVTSLFPKRQSKDHSQDSAFRVVSQKPMVLQGGPGQSRNSSQSSLGQEVAQTRIARKILSKKRMI